MEWEAALRVAGCRKNRTARGDPVRVGSSAFGRDGIRHAHFIEFYAPRNCCCGDLLFVIL